MVARKENVQREQQRRRKFGVPQSRLDVLETIEGYHLRWINDEPGRLEIAQDSGYTFVDPSEVGKSAREDSRVKELVGVQRDDKTPMYAYLMKIPMEFHLEDKDAMNSQLDQIDDAIRGGKLVSRDNGYVPDGGISYKK